MEEWFLFSSSSLESPPVIIDLEISIQHLIAKPTPTLAPDYDYKSLLIFEK
jgi:hypothetical protein